MLNARQVDEWAGTTPDTPVPNRVWKRVLARYDWTCQGPCNRPKWAYKQLQCDHRIAVVNWLATEEHPHGNFEGNLVPLCEQCHPIKTRIDVAAKAQTARRVEMRPAYKSQSKKPSRFARLREWKRRILSQQAETGE